MDVVSGTIPYERDIDNETNISSYLQYSKYNDEDLAKNLVYIERFVRSGEIFAKTTLSRRLHTQDEEEWSSRARDNEPVES